MSSTDRTENLWLHRPTGKTFTFSGSDRDGAGMPYAVMTAGDGLTARINPLALMRIDGDWQKVTDA